MIHYLTSDFFKLDADIEVCPCNCHGRMGKGIAKEFRDRYPGMYAAYQNACERQLIRPGTLHFHTLRPNKLIINIATKDHWNSPSQMGWVDWGLRQLALYLIDMPGREVAIPAIGCGNGGLRWVDVQPLMAQHLRDLKAEICIYPPPGDHFATQNHH